MRLTDYYSMKHLPDSKSKRRMDCVASSGSYPPFEVRAARSTSKRVKFYYSKMPEAFNGRIKKRANMVISDKGNFSTVFIPETTRPYHGFGDMAGTQDALLFLFRPGYEAVEVFVARGMRDCGRQLYNVFISGGLDDEIRQLREQAMPTNAVATTTPANISKP